MIMTLVLVAIPVCVIGLIILFYFQLKNQTSHLDKISPETVARLMDYFDTLQPYLHAKDLNIHDWGYMSLIIKRVLDVDDGDFPFLSSDEEQVLSEFVYGKHEVTALFRKTCQELWSRLKHLRIKMDIDVTGYGWELKR